MSLLFTGSVKATHNLAVISFVQSAGKYALKSQTDA